MRIYLLALITSLVFWVNTLNAQPAQIFQPLQKPVTRIFNLPVPALYPVTPITDSTKVLPLQNTLPLNFYSTHLGVACKMELKLEKQMKLPLRIRLGSKDQVDYLEGKYNRHQ